MGWFSDFIDSISSPKAPSGGTSNPRDARVASTIGAPANSAVDDFLMDVGLKEKNDVYDRDLSERRARGAAANEELMSRDDNDSAAVVAPVVAPVVEEEVTTEDTGTVLDETTDTALTEVETIGDDTFDDDRDFTGAATGTASVDAASVDAASVGTAAGGQAQFDAASATSVGEAEDAALELMKKGRRSTILTTPGGLLSSGEEEGKTRRRRSLIGG